MTGNGLISLLFPASRGLSRRGKMKREERDSAGFRRASYHACPRVSLTTSDVFVTCDTTQRTGLNLSASTSGCSNFKWTNQSWRWNDLPSGRCREPHYKSLKKAEEANFMANFSFFTSLSTGEGHVIYAFIWSEIYWALWNCWFYCDSGLFFLRRKRFVEWRLASDGWSGRFPCVTEPLSRRSKNERFTVARRETRKCIVSFKETKHDFSL